MKLHDHIMLYGVHIEGVAAARRSTHDAIVRKLLAKAVRVEITNVAEYMERMGKSTWSVDEDAPHAVSPWPLAWFEYRSLTDEGKPVRVGVLLTSTAHPDGGGWTVDASVYILYINQRAGHLGSVHTRVDGQGKRDGEAMFSMPDVGLPDAAMIDGLSTAMMPVYLAFTFAHCKNVSTVEHRTPLKVAKKRRKAGKPVGVTYKTLVIDGMKEALRTEGGVEKNGLAKALHICRGHFVTYTEDAPLFGKVAGTFWRPMHTRGSRKRGEVEKDYKIIAGE